MPTFPVRLPAALTVALCVACGGSSDPTSPQTQVVGTYALRTADTVQTCTWQLSGATLSLRWSDNTTATATFSGGNTLALSQDAYAYVFTK